MNKTYRVEDGKFIKGISLPIIIHNFNYHLTSINIFEDSKIDCWGLMDFSEFEKKVKSGIVRTSLPKGEMLQAFPLGTIESVNLHTNRSETGLLKEVKDILNRFKGHPTSENECIRVFDLFKNDPTDRNRQLLKEAYEAVPNHTKRFLLGDMDVDDLPIRAAIYGSDTFKESQKAKLQEKLIREYHLKDIDIDE